MLARPSADEGPQGLRDRLRERLRATVAPHIATCPVAKIRRAAGLSERYALIIRQGYVPHPRYYRMLAELVGVEMPEFAGGIHRDAGSPGLKWSGSLRLFLQVRRIG